MRYASYLLACLLIVFTSSSPIYAVVNILNFPADSPMNPYYSPPPKPKPLPPPAYIDLQLDFPEGDSASITVSPSSGNPFTVKLNPLNKKIQWKSRPLAAGKYEITFELPSVYASLPPQSILLTSGNTYTLYPRPRLLPKPPEVHVLTNIPEAIFLLRSNVTKEYWKGEGRDFSFKNLPQGNYTLTFSSANSSFYIPPKELRFYLNFQENKEIKAEYMLGGKIDIETNIEPSRLLIEEIGGKRATYREELSSKTKSVTLPQGRYKVTIASDQKNYTPPEFFEVTVKPFSTENINMKFTEGLTTPQTKHQRASSTPPQPIIPVLNQLTLIPAGPALIGDPDPNAPNARGIKRIYVSTFSIGLYEVTNAQYASWLTSALKAGSIAYIDEADQRGQVIDQNNHLLFKTFTADPYSQIAIQKNTLDGITFVPIPGKDLHPVINVTWYGATAFCKDNQCRLPTEAEWEKAAAMSPISKSDSQGKKFIYGFSQDKIDNTWANYKTSNTPIQTFRVLTTPVGFYNGINTLPLTTDSKGTQITHNAISPYGAYDMSGNVWEWVSDWYADAYAEGISSTDPQGPPTGTEKIVKGGCYDSLPDGLRASERMGLHPNHADAYTGFRVAKTKN